MRFRGSISTREFFPKRMVPNPLARSSATLKEEQLTAEQRFSLPGRDDYLLRKRILKLRWMGLDDEADLLAVHFEARPARTGVIPLDPRQTD